MTDEPLSEEIQKIVSATRCPKIAVVHEHSDNGCFGCMAMQGRVNFAVRAQRDVLTIDLQNATKARDHYSTMLGAIKEGLSERGIVDRAGFRAQTVFDAIDKLQEEVADWKTREERADDG